MQEVKKIAVIGPESTGKSTLCRLLAEYYNTEWCPEYAREYLLTHGTDYTYDTLLDIAKGQLKLEEEYVKKVTSLWTTHHGRQTTELSTQAPTANHKQQTTNYKLLFIDTDMYVMKVWCEFVFGKCHPFILYKLEEQKVDLYLLCNIDLPWVKDELREYPDIERREQLYNIYKDIMINQTVPWIDIHGHYEERVKIAIKGIDDYFFATGK